MATEIKNTDNTLLKMIRGNYLKFNFTIEDDSTPAVPLDLTGGTLWWTVKNHYNDADDDALILKSNTTHDDPTAGETSMESLPEDTIGLIVDKLYYFDFTFVTVDLKPITLARGNFQGLFNAKGAIV